MLLALDTATPYVTVCVLDDDNGSAVLASRDARMPMRHGELVTPLVAESLAAAGVGPAELTGIVVGVGPGPYTGLRVGVVTARMLGLALGVPVHGVCTLDALAVAAVDDGVAEPFLATTDARRKELFWASYDARGARVEGPAVSRPAEVPAEGRLVVGAGPALYEGMFPRARGPVDPAAAFLALAVATGRAELLDPEPLYLRRPDAVTPGPPKKVS